MRARGGILAAALCVWAGSPAVADVRIVAPVAGSALRAGTPDLVRWTGVPEESDELEILLLVGDGARIPVRLTGELDGRTRSFTWVVPNLPSPRARLLVRFEDEGLETEAEAGPSFEIVPDATRPIEEVRRQGSELWTGAGPASGDLPEAGLEDRPGGCADAGGTAPPALASFREDPGSDTVSVPVGGLAVGTVRPADVPASGRGHGFLKGISQRE